MSLSLLQAQWDHPLFKETAFLILGVLFASGVILFPFRNKTANTLKAWASLQSWLIGAPIVFLLIGSGHPWPYVGLVVGAIFACKEFFQMTGMYHRNTFVWLTYLSVIAMGWLIIGGNKVIADVSVPSGGYLIIDGTGSPRTAVMVAANGDITNVFDKTHRDQASNEYAFATLPPGLQQVSWDESFGFDVEYWLEQTGLPWT